MDYALKVKLLAVTLEYMHERASNIAAGNYYNEQAEMWMDGVRDGRIGDSTIQAVTLLGWNCY